MKQIFLLFTLPSILLATPSFAKGHGGGGHGGGHSHAHSGAQQSNTKSGSTAANHANAKHTSAKAIITRSTSPSVIAANHGRGKISQATKSAVNPVAGGPAVTTPHEGHTTGTTASTGTVSSAAYSSPAYFENYNNGYYGNPYYSNPYYANPYYYNPYYGMFSFGYGFMYSPSYYPVSSPNYANGTNDDQISKQPMDGFVVFYNDTLSGAVTVAKRAVSMETTDSGKDYDYRFHEKDPGLQCVTVYNDDDKQLNLVRLKGDTKKLWRVIHTGKLNIYDERRGFIYAPEDIDIKTLTVSYNGEIASLHSSSVKATKEWLTNYVNQAYGTNLDPKNFTWKELLIYVDKLN